jgi:hypothetical protein
MRNNRLINKSILLLNSIRQDGPKNLQKMEMLNRSIQRTGGRRPKNVPKFETTNEPFPVNPRNFEQEFPSNLDQICSEDYGRSEVYNNDFAKAQTQNELTGKFED